MAISPELRDEYEKQLRRIKRFIRQASKRGYDFPESAIPKHPKVVTEASVMRVASITPDTLYKKATYVTNTGEKLTGLEGRKHERKQAAIKAAETRARMKGVDIDTPAGIKRRTPVPHSSKKSEQKEGEAKEKKPRNNPRKKTDKKEGESKEKKPRKKPEKKEIQEKFYGNKDQKDKKKGNSKEVPSRSEVVLSNVLEKLEEMIAMWQPDPNWTAALTIYKTRDKGVAENILNSAISQIGREQVAKNCEEKAEQIIAKLEEILYASGSKEGNFKDGRTQVNFDIIDFQNMLLGRPTTPEENIELADLMERMLYDDADEDEEQYRSAVTYVTSVAEDNTYSTKKKDQYKWS